MAEIEVGGFVETMHGVNGILIGIRDSTEFGKWALIATADHRVFQCPIEDLCTVDDSFETDNFETEKKVLMQKNKKLQAMFNVMRFEISEIDIENLAEFILRKSISEDLADFNLKEFDIEKSISEKASNCDPYWDDMCKVLLKALLLYMFHEFKSEKQNFSMLFQLLSNMKEVEIFFEGLENKNPEHIALKYYKVYRNTPLSTRGSVQATLITRLKSLNIESLTD